MKAFFIFVIVLLHGTAEVIACTTFFINKDGHLVFGRNYDWITGAGMICTNLRNVTKTSAPADGKTTMWVSKYGSVTFNQYGKEFPMGGMNEKGLVVELMWLDGAKYQAADGRASLNVLQWIQYQLDNCATTDEVVATDKVVRISPANPPLHFLVADANGKAATIEFLNGELKVHQGKDLALPVLTNTDYHTLSHLNSTDTAHSGGQAAGYNDNSVERFVEACSMIKTYNGANNNTPPVDYAFDILHKVQVKDFTQWSIVYDMTNKTVFFKTASKPAARSLAMKDLDFSCNGPSLTYDLHNNSTGNIRSQMQPFTIEKNVELLKKSAAESQANIQIPDEVVMNMAMYAKSIECKN